jgi:hypothetical protein
MRLKNRYSLQPVYSESCSQLPESYRLRNLNIHAISFCFRTNTRRAPRKRAEAVALCIKRSFCGQLGSLPVIFAICISENLEKSAQLGVWAPKSQHQTSATVRTKGMGGYSHFCTMFVKVSPLKKAWALASR